MTEQQVNAQGHREPSAYDVLDLNLWYGEHHALKDINLAILRNKVTSIIGPSGCGKSTFIKTLNRMVEEIPGVRTTGDIMYHGRNILDRDVPVESLRARVGMVFQKPNPFPKSIFNNVTFGPRLHGIRDKKKLLEIAEKSLVDAALWDEVKDRLNDNAYGLSGGQQQRLCIARCLAVEPDVLLLDEPTSALDPIAAFKVEELIDELKSRYSIVIVTHSMQQAARISDMTAFFLNGEVIEYDKTDIMFSRPEDERTNHYISGRFG